MKLYFGNYTYFDGKADDKFYDVKHAPQQKYYTDNFAFDESKFNQLIANRQYNDAADYAAQFHFTDPATQKAHESDIINLRRSGRVLGAIYSRVQDPSDLAKITFADNVFVDGGLERMEKNEYSSQLLSNLERAKAAIGSEIEYNSFGSNDIKREATSLAVTFKPAKRTFLGIDFLAKDNENTIENFCNAAGISIKDLVDANVQVIRKDDNTTLKFDKSNPLANKILYYAPTKKSPNKIGDIPVTDFGGDIPVTITGYDKDGNTLGGSAGIENFKFLIDDARKTKEQYFKESNLVNKAYSSTIGPMLSDELSSLKDMLNSGQINETQYNAQARAIAPHIFSAIYTLGSGNYEMYTNYLNDKVTDETLRPVDNIDRGDITNLISNYDPKDIDVSAMVSNGKIGALITLKGAGNESKSNENDGRRIQIFVPGLLQEEVQAKINRNTSTRAIQEINSMIDWDYDYKLRNGSTISVNYKGEFEKDKQVIDKQTAIQEINKDMIMEDALSNLKFQYMNAEGNITDNLKYEEMAKLLAMNAAADIYGDIKLDINPQTNTVNILDNYGNTYSQDDIFNRNINEETTQYEIYDRLNEIYNMYNELMNELNFYK